MINMSTSFYWDHVIKYKFGERVFDTTQKSAVVFKEVKTIFCILCGKIQDSLQKYHTLMLNTSINSYKSILQVGID